VIHTAHGPRTHMAADHGQARARTALLWLMLLDEEGRPQPVVVPIDDIPVAPGSLAEGLAAGSTLVGSPEIRL